jgi:predicted Zn-dependent peptidase
LKRAIQLEPEADSRKWHGSNDEHNDADGKEKQPTCKNNDRIKEMTVLSHRANKKTQELSVFYNQKDKKGISLEEVSINLFKVHPYKDPNVGYMKDLDAATLEEFLAFNKKYYVPNNATLVVAGDIDFTATKKMIQDYFGPIPRGADVIRSFPTETPITEEFRAKAYDENIQIPAVIAAYRTPSFKTRDSKILDMISSYLSVGKSSVLYKKMVDTNKQALAVQAVNISQQDYGIYALFSLPLGDVTLDQLIAEMDEEIVKIQTDLISERAFQKLQNQFENNYVNSNSSVVGIAGSLASYHVMYGDTNLINSEIDIYRSVTREEIKDVANKYLNKNQRLILEYLPKKK